MGLSVHLQCSVHILALCRFFVGYHSAVYMWEILFSWRIFSCNSTVVLSRYELPTPLQKLCCLEIKSGKQKFFEVSPIWKTTAFQFVWLTALVLSQGMNCLPGDIFSCVASPRYIWKLQLAPVSSSKSSRLFAQCAVYVCCDFVNTHFHYILSSVMDRSSMRGFDTLRNWNPRQ